MIVSYNHCYFFCDVWFIHLFIIWMKLAFYKGTVFENFVSNVGMRYHSCQRVLLKRKRLPINEFNLKPQDFVITQLRHSLSMNILSYRCLEFSWMDIIIFWSNQQWNIPKHYRFYGLLLWLFKEWKLQLIMHLSLLLLYFYSALIISGYWYVHYFLKIFYLELWCLVKLVRRLWMVMSKNKLWDHLFTILVDVRLFLLEKRIEL